PTGLKRPVAVLHDRNGPLEARGNAAPLGGQLLLPLEARLLRKAQIDGVIARLRRRFEAVVHVHDPDEFRLPHSPWLPFSAGCGPRCYRASKWPGTKARTPSAPACTYCSESPGWTGRESTSWAASSALGSTNSP